jgi:hypothetical protein
MAITCEKWTPRRSNTLLGFADVLLGQTHLRIYDCAIHEKGGRRWVSLPGRPMIDREGVVMRDEHGKTKYARILEFDSREGATSSRRTSLQPCSRILRAHSRAPTPSASRNMFDEAESDDE